MPKSEKKIDGLELFKYEREIWDHYMVQEHTNTNGDEVDEDGFVIPESTEHLSMWEDDPDYEENTIDKIGKEL